MVGVLAILGGFAMGVITGPLMNPVGTWLSQEAFKLMPVLVPDPDLAIELRWRGLIDEGQYHEIMRKKGYHESYADKIFEASKRALDAGTLVSAKWRGIISEDEYYQYMARLNFAREDADKFERTMRYFPSPADLVHFAVREVYTPEIVEKYRMLEDLPPKFLEEAKKAGLDEEQAKNYWAAHWALPSLDDAFEMFHRGVITEDELKTLMRTLDIMPGWRDKLIQIAYTPYSRVDVRRMYAMGVLDRDGVYRAYRDLGYDHEKAEKLTEFTIKYEAREDIEAAVEPILSALKAKEITPEDAVAQLKEIGLTEEKAALRVNKVVTQMENEEREKWADVLSDLYVRGVLSYNDFLEALGKLNLSSQAMERIIAMADLERLKHKEFPTLAMLKSWWSKGIIDEQKMREIMERMNIDKEMQDNLIKDWTTPQEMETPRLPDKSDIRLWLRKGIIDIDTASQLLLMLRYPPQVVEWYIRDWVGS
jgi:Ca2+-binding EF-hand superfamily protein